MLIAKVEKQPRKCFIKLLKKLLLLFIAFNGAHGTTLITARMNGWTMQSGTYGYAFTVGTQPLIVEQLGVYDNFGDGLVSKNLVGIWTAIGDLVVSAEIKKGSLASLTGTPSGYGTFDNAFRWVNQTTPLILDSNTTYYLGSSGVYEYGSPGMEYTGVFFDYTGPPLSTDVAYLGSFQNGSFFTFSSTLSNSGENIGPNMVYSIIPEPSLVSLLITSGAVLMARKRKY